MGRWRPDARERLRQAALELFAEQGFAATTVPEITTRAGLTTRTFFRHFADKREVLFGGDEVLARASQLMADAPAALDPAALIVEGLRTVAETRFEGRRAEVRERRGIIRSDGRPRGRDLRKRADVAAVIRAGLISRGVAATTAALLADSTVTVLYVALDQWLDQDGDQPLFEIMLRTLGSLQEALGSLVTGDLGVSRPAGRASAGPVAGPDAVEHVPLQAMAGRQRRV